MILAALTVSAALTAPLVLTPPPQIDLTPTRFGPPAACADIARHVREDQRETLQKLGRLRDATLIYAVDRRMGGCAVPTPMGYHPPSLPGAADPAPH
jgi:hypothetical protein